MYSRKFLVFEINLKLDNLQACRLTLQFMGDLLGTRDLNEKIQYELQEFRQLNYETFIQDFIRIAVRFESYAMVSNSDLYFLHFGSALNCLIKCQTLSNLVCLT